MSKTTSKNTKPQGTSIKFRAKLWRYQLAKAAWYFVTLPYEESVLVKYDNIFRLKGFGSIPVEVKIGGMSWKTSLFPESKSGCYILPIKSGVRKKERIEEGDSCDVVIRVI